MFYVCSISKYISFFMLWSGLNQNRLIAIGASLPITLTTLTTTWIRCVRTFILCTNRTYSAKPIASTAFNYFQWWLWKGGKRKRKRDRERERELCLHNPVIQHDCFKRSLKFLLQFNCGFGFLLRSTQCLTYPITTSFQEAVPHSKVYLRAEHWLLRFSTRCVGIIFKALYNVPFGNVQCTSDCVSFQVKKSVQKLKILTLHVQSSSVHDVVPVLIIKLEPKVTL